MKEQTRDFLLEFIKLYSLNNDYTLIDLFYKVYAEREFSSVDELLEGIDEFFDFMINHNHVLKYNCEQINPSRLLTIIENSRANIKMQFSGKMFDSQQRFAEAITNIFDKPSEISLLDVGAGHTPVSSLFFAKKFKKVTAMDSHFYLSLQALKNMNVVGLNEYFNENTLLTDYDIIVGRAPCGAIEPIVKTCAQAQKPYIILLCDCAIPAPLKTDSNSMGWENILPKIDQNVRFYGQFAYNIDEIPDRIFESLKNLVPKKIKLNNQPSKSNKSNISIDEKDTFENLMMDYFQ